MLSTTPVQCMTSMVTLFSAMGVVEARPGVRGDPDFPEVMYVESLQGSRLRQQAADAAQRLKARDDDLTPYEQAGWHSEEHLQRFRSVRLRES
jgi:hypothetical protein